MMLEEVLQDMGEIMNTLTIFHCSPEIREKPVYGKGKRNNDYGQGFYCTQELELAKEWACVEGADGYVNQYEIATDTLEREDIDYAVSQCNMEADAFMELFLASNLALQFEHGATNVVAGISGTELVWEVFRQSGRKEEEFPEPQIEYDCSVQYWCGWILAYYQWYSGRSFREILGKISMAEIERMYPALHEASEDKFVDVAEKRMHC